MHQFGKMALGRVPALEYVTATAGFGVHLIQRNPAIGKVEVIAANSRFAFGVGLKRVASCPVDPVNDCLEVGICGFHGKCMVTG